MLAASWLTQRGQFRAQALVHEAVKREALYAEFIIEASKRFTDAWSRQAESPEVIAGLYSAVERMRLTSSTEVIRVEWSEAYAVKGFGCRPGASDRPSIGAGVGKPPKNEPAGSR